MDKDGYPENSELNKISSWDCHDFISMMEYIKSRWAYANHGYWKQRKYRKKMQREPRIVYDIATAGWSGNEEIIEAMQKNEIFWANCWVQSRRGGQYIFEVEL